MHKKVYKYATGQEVPKDAKYLCTLTETSERTATDALGIDTTYKHNLFVWHYYEVVFNDLPDEPYEYGYGPR